MLFIHIPKTGGHSVLEVMRAYGGCALKDVFGPGGGFAYHQRGHSIRDRMGVEVYDSFKKVTLMRNPWARAVGLYFGKPRKQQPSVSAFDKWLRHKWKDKRVDPLIPQSRMLTSDVIRFDLARIEELFHWMEVNLDIGPINSLHVRSGIKGERLPYREYFTGKTRSMVARANRFDIKRHGWTF